MPQLRGMFDDALPFNLPCSKACARQVAGVLQGTRAASATRRPNLGECRHVSVMGSAGDVMGENFSQIRECIICA